MPLGCRSHPFSPFPLTYSWVSKNGHRIIFIKHLSLSFCLGNLIRTQYIPFDYMMHHIYMHLRALASWIGNWISLYKFLHVHFGRHSKSGISAQDSLNPLFSLECHHSFQSRTVWKHLMPAYATPLWPSLTHLVDPKNAPSISKVVLWLYVHALSGMYSIDVRLICTVNWCKKGREHDWTGNRICKWKWQLWQEMWD